MSQSHSVVLNYIGGEFLSSHSKATLERFDPARGESCGTIARSNTEDVELAIQAALSAKAFWRKASVEKRTYVLRRVADTIQKRFDEFAAAESQDTGKPLKLARTVDIPRVLENFRFFADAMTSFPKEVYEHEQTRNGQIERSTNTILRDPLGVVVCISPWNLPLYLLSWKVAPALVSGNVVIAKPSEVTPLTAQLLAEVFQSVCQAEKIPPGIFSVLNGLGSEVGSALVSHSDVSGISFTGSTITGRAIAQAAAPSFKRVSLEMGGKNPTLIFAGLSETDFQQAVHTTVRSSFSNQGQICLCGSRILIQESVYEKFKTTFLAEVKKLRVGPPDLETSDLGAVVSKAHYEKVLGYFELAKKEGGHILCGGKRAEITASDSTALDFRSGWYLEPTVVEGLLNSCRTNQEEIFGPIVTLQKFASEEEAITLANSTRYGLAANLWSSDSAQAHRVAEALEMGIVWVNCWMRRDLRTPFGGVKESGLGREGGHEALRFFTEPKTMCVANE